jgi:hypothetical protein
MNKKLNLLLAVMLTQQIIIAQTPDEVKKVFPGQEMVFRNFDQQLKIFLKDDVPVAESNRTIDMMVLSEKNATAYSHYKIYHNGFEELENMDAYTEVPDGDKYKKVKITDQQTTSSNDRDVFYDDVKETSFDFSSLTQNAIAHVDYTQFYKDAHLLSSFYFPEEEPLMNGSFSVEVPDGINIKYVVKNDPKGLFQFSSEKKRKTTIYKWVLKNVKPIDDYYDAPDDRYFEPHVIIYITSYEGKNGTQNFLGSVDDLYKWDNTFIKELNTQQDPNLKKTVDSVIAGQITELDKAKSIYQWVQQNIRYVAFENGVEGFRPRQAADVCNKRYGDCKDMSSIITQMLRIAGIKAYYTWIGTRDIPYDYTDIPLPIVDNHMISTANINGQWLFLDGTDPHATFGVPPSDIQDKQALIAVNENEYKILRVPVIAAENNTMLDSTFISFTDEGIKGHEKVNYYGYFGEDVYNTLLYRDEKETRDYVKTRMGKASNKFILGDYTINKIDPANNVANITADFEIPGYGQKAGNEYYINLNLEKLFEKEIIDTAKRKVPREMEFKYGIKEYHILDIPDDYTVTYKPDDFNFNDDLVSIKMYYKIENGKIIAAQEVESKKLMINPEDFNEWNKAMKSVEPQYKETIVLEKK